MGLFGGKDSSEPKRSATDEMIDRQFQQNQAEIEQKKKSLYQERLDIIKSQGGQEWHPRR